MFDDTIGSLRAIGDGADSISRALPSLEEQAEQLATEDARSILLEELEAALATAPEFQHPELSSRLIEYFGNPNRVISAGGYIRVVVEDPTEAAQDWITAQKEASDLRRDLSNNRGWAANPSLAQRAAFWRNRVYGTELYNDTLEDRLSLMNLEAPFWYFLEYGTGPFAYPAIGGRFFLQKTKHRAEGTGLIDKRMRELERRIGDEFDDFVEETVIIGGHPPGPVVAWTAWYNFRGRRKRHQYYVGQGGFTGVFEYAD